MANVEGESVEAPSFASESIGGIVSAALAAATRWLPQPGRPRMSRRLWAGHGRAYIEIEGADEPGSEAYARHLEAALRQLDGVRLAEINAVLGRMVVAYDDTGISVESIVDAIEIVEQAHGKRTLGFPHDRPEHPGDVEPLRRQLIAIGADVLGAGVSHCPAGAAPAWVARGHRPPADGGRLDTAYPSGGGVAAGNTPLPTLPWR